MEENDTNVKRISAITIYKFGIITGQMIMIFAFAIYLLFRNLL